MARGMDLRSELIRSKLADIKDSVSLVETNLPQDFEDFSKLGLVKDGIYKKMEFAIENIIDICSIIVADLRLRKPENEDNIVEILVDNGIIDQKLGEKIRKMKGFRNIIVHRYGRIDDHLAHEILIENMNDFYDFISSIERFLEKAGCQ